MCSSREQAEVALARLTAATGCGYSRTGRGGWCPVDTIVAQVNAFLRGWVGYYGTSTLVFDKKQSWTRTGTSAPVLGDGGWCATHHPTSSGCSTSTALFSLLTETPLEITEHRR